MKEVVIVSGSRTPFGRLNGTLKNFTASDLAAVSIEESIRRSGLEEKELAHVMLGNVLSGGQGQIPARQAAKKGNISFETTVEMVNKVCASGFRAVTLTKSLLSIGEHQIALAGGMESMTNAPYFLKQARNGYRMGHGELLDSVLYDGLTCAFYGNHMGCYGDAIAKEIGISREEQDEWALRSHERAIQALDSGKMKQELCIMEDRTSKHVQIIEQDESVRRDSTIEKLRKLRPVFTSSGTITAGNAPGINDGAATMVLATKEIAVQRNLPMLATIVDATAIAIQPEKFPIAPVYAMEKLLQRNGLKGDDIALYEINEAFAVVSLAAIKMNDLQREKVNVNGGAVALGHPIGASGARIILTLAYELQRRGGGYGIAAICSGGGQGDAVLLKVE